MSLEAKFARLVTAALTVAALCTGGSPLFGAAPHPLSKLDPLLRQRASSGAGTSRIIVRMVDGAPPGLLRAIVLQLGGTTGRDLPIVNGLAGEVPNVGLGPLAASPYVERVSFDRVVVATMERTSATIGAAWVRTNFDYDGSGVGVAIIDSGVTSWHDDLTGAGDTAQRVSRFVDFVNGRETPYDDFGHGTHVAGIVAGNGFDSGGARAGVAPAARLIALKALDGAGKGRVSDVIAALDYIVAHKSELNIRVANLSLAAASYESYAVDPLTVAAQRVVAQGVVVIAAAGNFGRSKDGRTQYGGVMAPANAPWVLTVGASNHAGTIKRSDDSAAPFSSRGPAVGGYSAKPDLMAPGVGIESLSDQHSALYTNLAPYLLSGSVQTAYLPYLSLSGTSTSAPVVSGTVALMLQANPALTPNQVKAILQYTAQVYPKFDPLTQGAGFLNARGAVQLARHFAAPSGTAYPDSTNWSRRIIWGNRLFQGGRLLRDANAWSAGVVWGAETTPRGKSVHWGRICSGTACETDPYAWTTWDVSSPSRNVVWGSVCGGSDCQSTWSLEAVLGTSSGDTVVWGMDNGDTVVWGMNGDTVVWGLNGDTVVWGMGGDDTVVWGMGDADTVVWGMGCSDPSCEPVIWSQR